MKITVNRKKDFILIISVLLLAVALLGIQKAYGRSGNTVTVTVNHKVYGTFNLDQDKTIQIKNESGMNIVRIQNHEVWMEEADCPDGYCEEQGKINNRTQTIVCLPHKLVVEIEEVENSDDSQNEKKHLPDTISK